MDGNKPHGSVAPRYVYGTVEGALAAVFGAAAETQQGALRGRLKHFQRLGLPGIKAGKGARVTYTDQQAYQWLIALLLSEIGIDPVVTVRLIKKDWGQLANYVGQATDYEARAGNFIWLHLRPKLMTTPWQRKSKSAAHWIEVFRRWNPAFVRSHTLRPGQPGTIGTLTIDPPQNESRWVAENISSLVGRPTDTWICVLNLTDAALKFEAALQKGASDSRP